MKKIFILLLLIPIFSFANEPLKIPGFIPDFSDFHQTVIDNAIAKIKDLDEGGSWASPENWKRKEKEDEWLIHLRNPMAFFYDMAELMIKKEVYSTDGTLVLIKYFDPVDGKLLWADHQLGTGSGNFQVNSMATCPGGACVIGDRLVVKHGTYSGYQTIIQNLTGITIINDNSGLPVIMSGTALYYGGNTNCFLTGTGAGGLTYGFQWTGTANDGVFNFSNTIVGCLFDHGWVHDMINAPVIINGNGMNKIFDGVNTNTKAIVRCNFSFFLVHGKTGAIWAQYGNSNKNVMDSSMISHWTFDSTTTIGLIVGGSTQRDTAVYCYFGQQFPSSTSGDHGMAEIYGTFSFHHCIRIGQNWGWWARYFISGLNTPEDCYFYSNISQGNVSYGLVDCREDTTGCGQACVGSPSLGNPKGKGGNMIVMNNTCGNMKNVNTYVTAVLLNYGFKIAAFHAYAVKNFRYHSNNTNGHYNDTINVFDFGTPNSTIVFGNAPYVVDPLAIHIQDSLTTWAPKPGSPLIGTPDPPGSPFFMAVALTDYNNKSFASPRVVGAVEPITACSNCAAYPRNDYPKNSP